MNFSIKDFFSKCDQIRIFYAVLLIFFSHLKPPNLVQLS